MRHLIPEQLPAQLQHALAGCYLLCGQDLYLQQESQQLIRQAALAQGFTACPSLLIESTTEWQAIEQTFQALPLFATRRLLPLTFNASVPNALQSQQLMQLPSLLDSSTVLMLILPQLKKNQEQAPWFKAYGPQVLYIACHSPLRQQWPGWVQRRAKALGLRADAAVIEQLCFYYEGNLLALVQLLEQLALRYPDGQLTLPRINPSLQDSAQFTPQQWLNALLLGQTQRALHSLRQLQATSVEPVRLLRTLQGDLLLLIHFKRQMTTTPLRELFDREAIWQVKRQALTSALQRLSTSQLLQALYLLTQLELRYKSEGATIWQELRLLSLLLCGNPVPPALLEC
jgi:DNA polymerase III subunit delta